MTHNHSTDELKSNLLSSSSAMRRKYAHRRFRLLEHYRLLITPKAAFFLFSTCILTCTCFAFVLLLNISTIKSLLNYSESHIYSGSAHKPDRKLSVYDQHIVYKDFNYLKLESLTYLKRNYSTNVPILYRLPQQVEIKALLLIFHGCSRSAHDWFHTIERQRIIGSAIDLGYGCLAFQATDETRRCWANEIDLSINPDVQMVIRGLEGFYKEHPKLESLPRYTFGASSGGVFSSIFVINSRYPIQGQILFISIIHPDILEGYIGNKAYPPTAWIYMVRDEDFASEIRINASINIFKKEKIPYATFPIEPISVKPITFYERIPTISIDTSHYLYYRFIQNRWLDERKFFIHNPRRVNTWQTFIYQESNDPRTQKYLNNLEKHKDILPDFLNTIYGEHEISFERSYEALNWLQRISTKKQ